VAYYEVPDSKAEQRSPEASTNATGTDNSDNGTIAPDTCPSPLSAALKRWQFLTNFLPVYVMAPELTLSHTVVNRFYYFLAGTFSGDPARPLFSKRRTVWISKTLPQ
jgi:hypothetical protein